MIVVTVARRPLAGSVAANVLEHGTGPINVDGTRISAPGEEISSHTQGVAAANRDGKVYQAFAGGLVTHQTAGQRLGRWPANLILEHLPACRRAGIRKLKPLEGHRPNPVAVQADGNIQFTRKAPGYQKVSYTGDDGLETVEAWECVAGCPVHELDASVGPLTSGKPAGVKHGKGDAAFNEFNARTAGTPLWGYGDTGGASRFFKVVQGDEP